MANIHADENNQGRGFGRCPSCGGPNPVGSTECGYCKTGFQAKGEVRGPTITFQRIEAARTRDNTAIAQPVNYGANKRTKDNKTELSVIMGLSMACLMTGAMIGPFYAMYTMQDYSNNQEYHFNDKIDGESISFTESRDGQTNYLTVYQDLGSYVKFIDLNDNLKLDRVDIKSCHRVVPEAIEEGKIGLAGIVDCQESSYRLLSNNPQAQQIVKDNQAVFDSYLNKILKANTAPLKEGK
jgi:hypothetical protein